MNIPNNASPVFPNDMRRAQRGEGFYGFEWQQDSRTLAQLNGCRELLQAILSQAGSFLLTGMFHNHWTFTIGKAEGGFIIPGRGEFIPARNCIAMDPPSRRNHSLTADADCFKLTNLLTAIVLDWNPARHENSMYEVAAAHVGTTPEALRKAVEDNRDYQMRIACLLKGQSFGDPISYFFDWNTPVHYDAKYRDFWLKQSSTIQELSKRFAGG